MGSVGTPVVRRMIQVAHGPHDPDDLLARVGLSAEPEGPSWAGQSIDEDTYYDLIEHIAWPDDHGFPFRYADALDVDDLGAIGLAVKTAPTIEGALERLVRYVLVLSDTLEYELVDAPAGRVFALTGRSHHRRGAALANECALAAVLSSLRQILGSRLTPVTAMFRHPGPADDHQHRAFFGCTVSFEADVDGIHLSHTDLAKPTLLADDGLSTYLLHRLDNLKAQRAERSIVDNVRSAIADALPDGQPNKSRIARRLGMSERTLHRHLADHGETLPGHHHPSPMRRRAITPHHDRPQPRRCRVPHRLRRPDRVHPRLQTLDRPDPRRLPRRAPLTEPTIEQPTKRGGGRG